MADSDNHRPSLPWEEPLPVQKPPEFLSAPDMMLKGIHMKLLHFFNFCTDLSSALTEGSTIKELFEVIDRESNGEYRFLLECYHKTANYYPNSLLESIISWKNQETGVLQSKSLSVPEEKFRCITNYIFGRIAIQILTSSSEEELDARVARCLADTLLDEFSHISNVTTEGEVKRTTKVIPKKSEQKESDSCSLLRKEVQESYIQTLGLLSRVSFFPVMESFYDHMKSVETPSIRVQLIGAMKNVALPFSSKAELAASTSFVTFVVEQIQSKKAKLETIQSFATTLGEMLMLMCELQNDTKDWHYTWREFVTETYHELKKTCKRFKDPLAATVLEVGVMCAGQKFLLGQQPIVVLDRLIKMIKAPEKRNTTVDCIFFVITCLFRNYDQTEFDISKDLMLEKIRTEIFHTLRKGTHKECIPALVDLVFLICIFDLQYAFSHFILPMVSPDSSVELQLIGLLTFNLIADSTHLTFDKTYAYTKRPPNPVQDNYRRSVHTQFRLEEFGTSSLNLTESMLDSFRVALGKVILHADSSVGNVYQRTTLESTGKGEKSPYLDVLRTAITCIARTPPSGISSAALMQFLIHKSFHSDLRIAVEAQLLLSALVRTRPVLRSTIMEEVGKLVLVIPEENTPLIRKVATLLINLLIIWHDPMALNEREVDNDFIDTDVCNRALFAASLIEGIAMVLLCSPSVHVRNVAYNILHEVRSLNSVLPAHLAERGSRVIDVIEKYEKQLFHMSSNGVVSFHHFSSVEEIIYGCSEGGQEEWARCLGALIPFLREEKCRAIHFSFSIICTRMEALTSSFISIKKSERPLSTTIRKELATGKDDSVDEVILWRNMLLLACAVTEGENSIFVSDFGYLSTMDINWLIDLTLPGLFIGSERVRDALQVAFRYSKDTVAFTLPNLIYLYLEQKRKEASHNRDIVRIETSRLFSNLTEQYLHSDIINRPLEIRALNFISETLEYLTQPAQEVLWALQQQRCDFFKICACLFDAMVKKSSNSRVLKPSENQHLLHFALGFAGHGPIYWEYKERELKMKESFLERFKDKELSQAEELFVADLRLVQDWASQTLPGLLQQESVFDLETFGEKGALFLYATAVFEFESSERRQKIARSTIISAIQTNYKEQNEMMRVCVQNSYHKNEVIAHHFFLIVSEAVTSPGDISYPLMPVFCLALYKMTDINLAIRKSAAELIHWLSTRFFRTHLALQFHHASAQTMDNYSRQLKKFTDRFASLHGDLVVEVITEWVNRLARVEKEGQHRMTMLIISFLPYLDMEFMDISLLAHLLETFLLLSSNLSAQRPDLVRLIWSSLGQTEANIKPISQTLLSIALARQNFSLLSVLQQAFVYLARAHGDFLFERLLKDVYSTSKRSLSIPSLYLDNANRDSVPGWSFNEMFPTDDIEVLLCKGEYVLILLSELVQVVEKEAWVRYIPTLFTLSLVSMDHSLPVVYESAKILLSNIVYCSLEDSFTPGTPLASLYKHFTSFISNSGSRPLWTRNTADTDPDHDYDDKDNAEKVKQIVSLSLELLHYSFPNIHTQVGVEALQVSSNINLTTCQICDALLLYRCIDLPEFTPEDIHELIGVLLLHIQNRESRQQVSVVIQIQRVFERVIESCSSSQIMALPKIFWCGVALLRSDISRDYLGGVAILSKFIEKIDLTSNEVQKYLHSCFPHSWTPSFPGLSILLLKGFCSKEQERDSRLLMCNLISPSPSDIVDADITRSHVVFVISLLPHLLTFLGGEHAEQISQLLATSLAHHEELSKIFQQYEVYRSSMEGLRRFLLEVVDKFTAVYFPTYESFVFTFLVGMLEKGPKQHNKTILQIIAAFLRKIDFATSSLLGEELAVFAPVLNFLQGDLWAPALSVMEVIFSRSVDGSVAPFEQDQLPLIRERMAQCQKISDYWNQLEQGKAVVFSALAKVIQSGEEEQLCAHKENMKPILATLKAPRNKSPDNTDGDSSDVKVKKRKRKVSKLKTDRPRRKSHKRIIKHVKDDETCSLDPAVDEKEHATPKELQKSDTAPSPLAFLRSPAPSINNNEVKEIKTDMEADEHALTTSPTTSSSMDRITELVNGDLCAAAPVVPTEAVIESLKAQSQPSSEERDTLSSDT